MSPGSNIVESTRFTVVTTPIGPVELRASGGSLCGLSLPDTRHPPSPAGREDASDPVLIAAARQLGEYFAGHRRAFDLPLSAQGTSFQRRVWRQLLEIPYGSTCSYGALARALCHPSASRAVGAANGRNPISIIIPCHRVIGSDGSMTGYGGGEPAKRWLLGHEARWAQEQPTSTESASTSAGFRLAHTPAGQR